MTSLTRLRASWDFQELFLWVFVLSLKSWSSVNTIYRNFICGPLCKPSQESFSFSEFIYLTGANDIARLGLVYPPENLMLMSCMAGRCYTTNRRQEICYQTDSLIHGRNSKSCGNWHTTVVFGCTSPCLPLHGLHLPSFL
jgi:hypothetical protein